MSLNYFEQKSNDNTPGYSRTKKLSLWLAFVLIIVLGIETISCVLNSGEHGYFVKQVHSGKDTTVFNSYVISNYYNRLTSIPYNYFSHFKSVKSQKSFRVFLLGEASITGWPYSGEQSIQKKLEKLFNSRSITQNIEIITIGTAGFNTSLALDIIPHVLEYKPDLIIIYSGHNEFYGYKGYTKIAPRSELYSKDFTEKLLLEIGLINPIKYESPYDDFEVLLPFNSNKQIIALEQNEYRRIKNGFISNIDKIISICKDAKTSLVLTALADNCYLPPVGVINNKNGISADIIYNNARMALLRDGNQNAAIELFNKSKDTDALRLRISEDFIKALKKVSVENDVVLADMRNEFKLVSAHGIPGNDLFVDYIHPNSEGLNIISTVYADLILKAYSEKYNLQLEPKPEACFTSVSAGDSVLAQKRINRSFGLIRSLGISREQIEVALKENLKN